VEEDTSLVHGGTKQRARRKESEPVRGGKLLEDRIGPNPILLIAQMCPGAVGNSEGDDVGYVTRGADEPVGEKEEVSPE